jgi:hypothetical protein
MIEILFEGHTQTHHYMMRVVPSHYDVRAIANSSTGREGACSVFEFLSILPLLHLLDQP